MNRIDAQLFDKYISTYFSFIYNGEINRFLLYKYEFFMSNIYWVNWWLKVSRMWVIKAVIEIFFHVMGL